MRLRPARLSGSRLIETDDWLGPRLMLAAAGEVAGQVAELTPDQADRLGFFAQVAGLRAKSIELNDGAAATAWFHEAAGAVASASEWRQRWAAIAERTAADVMQHFGARQPDAVASVLPQILVRAASWVRAQAEDTPMDLRSGFAETDVRLQPKRQPYLNFFALEEQELSFRRFGGVGSATVERAAFVMGDAVTVLPYDPHRDRVLLVEQFRFGPLARGDRKPWSLEPIAGRIDPGETPQEAARRETIEESGLALRALLAIGNYYPSPGAVSEYLFSYLGLADLPDGAACIAGLDSESEDIRGVLVPFDSLMDLLATGEAQNGPLILSALWLAANRNRLRRDA